MARMICSQILRIFRNINACCILLSTFTFAHLQNCCPFWFPCTKKSMKFENPQGSIKETKQINCKIMIIWIVFRNANLILSIALLRVELFSYLKYYNSIFGKLTSTLKFTQRLDLVPFLLYKKHASLLIVEQLLYLGMTCHIQYNIMTH